MNKTEITRATQFTNALVKYIGKEVNPKDVKIGRLDVNDEKENGYVCFYAFIDDKIYYMKAFKGRTDRVIKVGTIGEEVSVRKEYIPVCFFISAYHSTTWKVNNGEDGIFLTEK